MYTSTGNATLAISIVFPILAAIFVGLRFSSRKIKSVSIKTDDWLIVVALIMCIAMGINCTYGVVKKEVGVPLADMSEAQVVAFLKILFINPIFTIIALAVVKISILSFYKRIFITKRFHLIANILIVVFIAWGISSLLCQIFAQFPVSSGWNPTKTSYILNYGTFLMAHASLDLFFDIVTLCLPLPMIRSLQMEPRKRAIATGIFSLGFFCVIAEAVRIYYQWQYLYSNNTTHAAIFSSTVANILIWSTIEPCCSVIAACLPTLGPLVTDGYSPLSMFNSIRSFFSDRSGSNLSVERTRKTSDESNSTSTEGEEAKRRWEQMHQSGNTVIGKDEGKVREGDGIFVEKSFASESHLV